MKTSQPKSNDFEIRRVSRFELLNKAFKLSNLCQGNVTSLILAPDTTYEAFILNKIKSGLYYVTGNFEKIASTMFEHSKNELFQSLDLTLVSILIFMSCVTLTNAILLIHPISIV